MTQALVDTFESKALAALWSAFQTLASEADAARAASDEDWCVLPATGSGNWCLNLHLRTGGNSTRVL